MAKRKSMKETLGAETSVDDIVELKKDQLYLTDSESKKIEDFLRDKEDIKKSIALKEAELKILNLETRLTAMQMANEIKNLKDNFNNLNNQYEQIKTEIATRLNIKPESRWGFNTETNEVIVSEENTEIN